MTFAGPVPLNWWDYPGLSPVDTFSERISLQVTDFGQEIVQFTNAQGDAVQFYVAPGGTGRFSPPMETYEDIPPIIDGSFFRGARVPARTVLLPIHIPDGSDRTWVRTMARVMNPTLGPGILRTISNGTTDVSTDRCLYCIYQGGLEAMTENIGAPLDGVLQFYAYNPYWASNSNNKLTINPGSGQGGNWEFASGQWFPWSLVAANFVAGTYHVVTQGDVNTWPIIDFVGPGSGMTVINLSSPAQDAFAVNGSLNIGDHLLVDMRPGHKTVYLWRNGAFVNWYSQLSSGYGFFPIYTDPVVPGGDNLIEIDFQTVTGQVNFYWQDWYFSV